MKPVTSSSLEETWRATLRQVAAFRAEHDRYPMQREPGAGHELARWMSRQRIRLRAGTLSADRERALDEVCPGWRKPKRGKRGPVAVTPRTAFTPAWEAAAAELRDFVHREQRFPKSRAADPVEAQLGHWLRRARKAAVAGVPLWTTRATRLDELIPGWRGQSDDERFAEQAHKLAAFIREHGHRPSRCNTSPEEQALALWIHNVRTAAAGRPSSTRWTPEREALLTELVPDWRGGWPRKRVTVFAGHCGSLRRYYAEHGHRPRSHSGDSEAKLARWLYTQRRKLAAGRLSGEEIAQLNDVCPDWAD